VSEDEIIPSLTDYSTSQNNFDISVPVKNCSDVGSSFISTDHAVIDSSFISTDHAVIDSSGQVQFYL